MSETKINEHLAKRRSRRAFDENKPVSEICHRFEPLPQILKNVKTRGGAPLADENVNSAIEKLRASLGGKGRLIIRPSGTEPVIRVMAEGDDRDLVEKIVDDVIDVISRAA